MAGIAGFDHVAITVADLEAPCRFYDRLFGAETHVDHIVDGRPLVRQIRLGGAMLSVHQAGNGIDLVARRPTEGSADICFRWSGTIASAAARLDTEGIALVEGPSPRRTSDGASSQSVYFHDPDGNLIELMAAD